MAIFKILIVFISLFFYNFSLLGAESDTVKTSSSDFETGNFEDEIYDPLEPINRAIFGLEKPVFQ